MVALPFYTPPGAAKPPTDVNVYTFDLGGPIVKDKTHFFGGYEHTERDLSGLSVITITPANQAVLGLTEPAYQPRGLNTEFAIGKVDHQLSAGNRLSVRYMFFDNFITANVGGGLLSVQRANDFADRQHSTGAQLISTLGARDAERTARAVRDARAEPRAECDVGHRSGHQHHRRRPVRRPGRRASRIPGLASRRTCCRSTTT